MALFKHPCLVHGTVHTPFGAFTIVRGLVEMPDEIGEAMGWPQLNEEHATSGATHTGVRELQAGRADSNLSR